MEAFDLYAFTSSLSYLQIGILLLVALFASIVSGISGYGGGLTLGILVSPFIPIKLLVPLMRGTNNLIGMKGETRIPKVKPPP
jgi:uncharacterized protein